MSTLTLTTPGLVLSTLFHGRTKCHSTGHYSINTLTLVPRLRSPPAAGIQFELNVTATGCSTDNVFNNCPTVLNLYTVVVGGDASLAEHFHCKFYTTHLSCTVRQC